MYSRQMLTLHKVQAHIFTI